MSVKEHIKLQKATQKPSAAQNDEQVLTQTGLWTAIRVYETRPPQAQIGQSKAAWVEIEPVPKLVVYKNGKFYETALPIVP